MEMEIIELEKSSSKKKEGMRPVCGLPSGLLTFDSYRRRFGVARRVRNESSIRQSLRNRDEAIQSQAAKSSKDMNLNSRELTSIMPSYKHDLKEAMKTHTRDKLTCSDADTCLQLDECISFRQLQIHEDCKLKEGNPLSALLNGSSSPLAKCDDAQKLAWLKSQLIGENQEFLTPFAKRRLVYADHTASGRSLIFIEDFIAQNLLPFYGNTHTDDSYVGRRTSRMMKQAEDYMKEKLGGSKDDVLLMCGWGCTAAIKRLQEVMGITVPSTLRAQVLHNMMQGAGSKEDERWLVFTGPYEHHSNLLSWRQSLAEVVEIPANEKGEIDMGKLEAALRAAEASGRKNKIGSFSACSNVTGVLSDTRTIARLLHKYGAFACFDFAAGAPHFQIEMQSSKEDGYDAIMLSPHKLLGGPGTPGLLLMRKRLYKLEKYPPSTCGGGTVAYVNGFNEKDTLYYERIEEREEGGTPPIVGKVRSALAFWLKEAMGQALIEQRETLYMNKAVTRLSSHPNIEILGGCPSLTRAPILSILIYPNHGPLMLNPQGGLQKTSFKKPLHGRFVVKLLNDLFGIQARGGCLCAAPYGHMLLGISHDISLAIRSTIKLGYEGLKPGWARISLCYSMTDEEVDYIILAVELLADYGQRFLALYDFDFHTGNWTYTANGDALCNKKEEQLLTSNQVTIPKENHQQMWGELQQSRQFLRFAETLSHLLPKFPPPKPIPKAIDPDLLLFYV